MIVLLFLFLGGTALLFGGGCAGKNSSSSPVSTSAETGRATLTVRWPERSRLIPFAAESIDVRIVRGESLLGQRLMTRPQNGGNASVTFEQLPTGAATVVATAYPNADGSGVAQAQGSVPVTVLANQTVNVHLTMATTITRLGVEPATVSINVGQSVTPVATAYDAENEVVLTKLATYTWTSDHTAIALVEAGGKITALATGTATITATETESGKKATIAVTVIHSPTPTPTPTPTGPPSDATFNPANGHYYKVISVPAGITWVDAKAAAEAMGGYLATITSSDENQFVANLVNPASFWHDSANGHFGPWLGGYQEPGSSEPGGGWKWVTGEPFNYSHWCPGDPDNATSDEDKLHYFAPPGQPLGSLWNDFPNHYSPDPVAYVVEWGSPSSPAPTPISWWRAENNTLDTEGRNNGTAVGNVQYADGVSGKAFDLNGLDTAINVPDNDSLKITGSMTIDVWIKPRSFPSGLPFHARSMIIHRGDWRAGFDAYYLGLEPQGLIFNMDKDGAQGFHLEAPITLNQWHHVTATVDGTTGAAVLYMDGAVVAQGVVPFPRIHDLDPNFNPGVGIGNHPGYPNDGGFEYSFDGLIDELKIYDTVVPPSP